MILDGWGNGHHDKADVISTVHPEYISAMTEKYPHAELRTDGENVGLPEGQMGNSEVGHLNIGAGRVVYQDLVKINRACRDNSIMENPEVKAAFEYAKKNGVNMHFMGLVSDGGVHSSLEHLFKLCDISAAYGLDNTYVHCFMDGRDTDPRSGKGFIADLEKHLAATTGKIATVIGRYYAMDRDKRWERVKIAYDALVNGIGERSSDMVEAVQKSYDEGVTDEFIKPFVRIDENGQPVGMIRPNDVVIFFNYRNDRAKELTVVLTQEDMPAEGMHTMPLYYCCMTPYDAKFTGLHILFDKENVPNTIGEYVSKLGLRQLRIAETEKYAHVTFFLNGGREAEFEGEERILVASPKVATYDLQPEMSAPEVADKLAAALGEQKFDFICLNFANGDMVGHTGVYEAIVKAVKAVDGCVAKVVEAAKANGYEALHSTVMGPDGVWVEVQIRTQRMEDIAERGFAAHWKYKHATISQDEDEFDKWLKQIRAALNSPTENAVDFLDNFKLSLYTSEIVVFTPKGEARKMPFGATALDFAYDIHSKIGNSAISAKINHKLEPITTQINSGDQIEIITADNARPKPEWLEIATTAKAKQSIKSFLKRERQNNIERGMQMLDEKMKSLNIKLSGRVLRKIVPIYESNNKEELYSKIGAGIIDLKDLDKVLKVNSKSKILKFWTLFINKKEDEEGDDPAAINDAGETAPNAAHPAKEQPEAPQFEIAECCKPIPGDKVVGYRDPGTGNIIVHKATCDELNRLATQFGRNIVKEEIKWSQHKAMSYLVTIELRGIDRMGILLDLAKVVSADFSINIREVGIHSHDGIFEGSISLYVKDAEGLQDVMTRLRKIKGIESVKRTLS